MAPLATEKTLDRGLGGRCQEKINAGPAAPKSTVVSPYVVPNSTWHTARAERRKWGRTGQGRDTLSASLNIAKLTERAKPTQAGLEYDLASADSCPESHGIKKKGGEAEDNIHTCSQNRQRTAETVLKCTKILKQHAVHQEQRRR